MQRYHVYHVRRCVLVKERRILNYDVEVLSDDGGLSSSESDESDESSSTSPNEPNVEALQDQFVNLIQSLENTNSVTTEDLKDSLRAALNTGGEVSMKELQNIQLTIFKKYTPHLPDNIQKKFNEVIPNTSEEMINFLIDDLQLFEASEYGSLVREGAGNPEDEQGTETADASPMSLIERVVEAHRTYHATPAGRGEKGKKRIEAKRTYYTLREQFKNKYGEDLMECAMVASGMGSDKANFQKIYDILKRIPTEQKALLATLTNKHRSTYFASRNVTNPARNRAYREAARIDRSIHRSTLRRRHSEGRNRIALADIARWRRRRPFGSISHPYRRQKDVLPTRHDPQAAAVQHTVRRHGNDVVPVMPGYTVVGMRGIPRTHVSSSTGRSADRRSTFSRSFRFRGEPNDAVRYVAEGLSTTSNDSSESVSNGSSDLYTISSVAELEGYFRNLSSKSTRASNILSDLRAKKSRGSVDRYDISRAFSRLSELQKQVEDEETNSQIEGNALVSRKCALEGGWGTAYIKVTMPSKSGESGETPYITLRDPRSTGGYFRYTDIKSRFYAKEYGVRFTINRSDPSDPSPSSIESVTVEFTKEGQYTVENGNNDDPETIHVEKPDSDDKKAEEED